MIELEQFPTHLASLNRNDWERLFALIPEIESTEKFGEINGGVRQDDNTLTFPYWNSTEIVDKTFKVISELKKGI